MADASTHTITIMQLFSVWEIHLLILLSFALQIFLFICGGLRRRNNHVLLRITVWISYMSADFIAAYALGHLSRNLPTTSTTTSTDKPVTNQLTILWAPFLLIHLGGQDTVTAFSLEDNELWLRHLLNLIVQACLVVYVLWKWMALAQYQVVIPAAFLFVAGILKYGERIWALQLGSLKGLRTSTRRDAMKESLRVEEIVDIFSGSRRKYQEIILDALQTEQCVRYIFAGRKLDMLSRVFGRFLHYVDGGDAQVSFKRVEMELSIMYDGLFTKSRVIQTRHGGILRCVSLASTVVAFALFMTTIKFDYTRGRSRADAAITYILFIGAFCLEALSFFIVLLSPWEWPVLEAARGGWCSRVLLLGVAWPVFMKIQPDTKPWWSNSVGQYNLLTSSLCKNRRRSMDSSKWSSSVVMTKMAGLFGARERWNKMRDTKHVKVTKEMKKLISDSIGYGCIIVPSSYGSLFALPFEEALVVLHLWTDVVVHKAGLMTREAKAEANAEVKAEAKRKAVPEYVSVPEPEDEVDEEAEAEAQRRRRPFMDTCKTLSNYMLYLLVEHPAVLPGQSSIEDLLERSLYKFIDQASDKANQAKEGILPSLVKSYDGPGVHFWQSQKVELRREEWGIEAELEILEQVWVRMLLYAAGKSRPGEHARRLSSGVELITFIWLLMAHHSLGDVDTAVSLTTTAGGSTNTAAVYLMDPARDQHT